MTNVRYLHVTVTLVGEDGNAFVIIARVQAALRSDVDRAAARPVCPGGHGS